MHPRTAHALLALVVCGSLAALCGALYAALHPCSFRRVDRFYVSARPVEHRDAELACQRCGKRLARLQAADVEALRGPRRWVAGTPFLFNLSRGCEAEDLPDGTYTAVFTTHGCYFLAPWVSMGVVCSDE